MKHIAIKKLNVIKRSLLLIFFFTTTVSSAQEIIDKRIATVGNKIIILSDIQSQHLEMIQQGFDAGENPECFILEQLLFQKLLAHQADVDSIEVTDEQVEADMDMRMRSIIAQFPGGEEQFEEFYGQTALEFKEEFRGVIEERLKSQAMQSQIASGVTVTPDEIMKFYESIPKDSLPFVNSKIEVAHIRKMPYLSTEEKDAFRQKLQDYRTDILSGKYPFGAIAGAISEDPGTARDGGEFDWVTRGTFVPEFDAIAFSLNPGELSEVFETDYGFHILELIERRGDMYKGRHILIIPKVSAESMQKAVSYLDSVATLINEGKYTFEQAAKLFSDDDETKYNGGVIYNPMTGDTQFDMGEIDRPLFVVVDRLDEGSMSDAIAMQTTNGKQGFRLVKLNHRTKPHVANLKDDYNFIQGAALSSKQQEVINKWAKDKISSTYINIDEDYKECEMNYEWIKTPQ